MMKRPAERAVLAGLLLAGVAWMPVSGIAQSVTREALLRAEDARGAEPEGIATLLAGLRVPELRAMAIRALGRLERPEVADTLLPFLGDSVTRSPAAEAVAQSLRGLPPAATRSPADAERLARAWSALAAEARRTGDPGGRGAVARSLARLPFATSTDVREVERVLTGLISPARFEWRDVGLVEDVAAGLYTIARTSRTLGEPSPDALTWLRQAAVVQEAGPIAPSKVAPVRRLAWLALNAARAADTAMIRVAMADRDLQVRRQAVLALPAVADSAFRRAILAAARRDTSFMVRLDWVTGHRMLSPADCGPLLEATMDRNPHVMLAAIDALGASCADRAAVVSRLQRIMSEGPAPGAAAPARAAGTVSWHGLGHALVALARVDPADGRVALRAHAGHPNWQARMYVARGAAVLRDTALLNRLAFDGVGSVREVAIAGLSAIAGHEADEVYVRALDSPDHHVVLAAARALRGTTGRAAAVPALVAAFARLSERGEQTSRDPRMELLARIDEMATPSVVPVLVTRATDVDERVAAEAVRIARRLDPGLDVTVRPSGRPAPVEFVDGLVSLRVTMAPSSGGGAFTVRLNTTTAPITASRVVALVRAGYYDGLTFHRVAPNFVLQGGSPAMNEYVGIGPFMRDEVGLGHHDRGSLGISTRGRDTGDGQWFINLIDNYRLDHEYTVFGVIMPADLGVVDGILEGDVIETIRVTGHG